MFESVEQLEKEVKEFRKNILASTDLVNRIDGITVAINALTHLFAAQAAELTGRMDLTLQAMDGIQAETLKKLVEESHNLGRDFTKIAIKLGTKIDTNTDSIRYAQNDALAKTVSENRALVAELAAKGDQLLKDMTAIPAAVAEHNRQLEDGFRSGASEMIEAVNMAAASLRTISEAFAANCTTLIQSVTETNQAQLANIVEVIDEAEKGYLCRFEAATVAIQQGEAELNRKSNDFLAKLDAADIVQLVKASQAMQQSMDATFRFLMVGVGISILLLVVTLFTR